MEIIAPTEPLLLPAKLAEVISAERIRQNEEALLATAPDVEPAALEEALHSLSGLYLVHGTDSKAGFRNGLLPYAKHNSVDDNMGMTFEFDKSLGLDQCIFFNWPLPEHVLDFAGSRRLLVDSSLLLDRRCFVTPKDIFQVANVTQDEIGQEVPDDSLTEVEWKQLEGVYEEIYDGAYQQIAGEGYKSFTYDGVFIPKEVIEVIKKRVVQQFDNLYFNKLVSGAVWLEFVARKLAAEGPDAVPRCEVKFNGAIPPSKIAGIVSAVEFKDVYLPYVKETLTHGSAA